MSTNTQHISSLELFRSLIKDGCEWHGDVLSKKWSEQLFIPDAALNNATRTLSAYVEGVDYKLDAGTVWIA